MADFDLVKSFDIDDGELEGLSLQECFVLGYELAQIDHLVAEPGAASRPVHALNRERIGKSCKDADREYRSAGCLKTRRNLGCNLKLWKPNNKDVNNAHDA